jgi:hypothetical protein
LVANFFIFVNYFFLITDVINADLWPGEQGGGRNGRRWGSAPGRGWGWRACNGYIDKYYQLNIPTRTRICSVLDVLNIEYFIYSFTVFTLSVLAIKSINSKSN